MQKSSIGAGWRSVFMFRVQHIWCFDPTFIQWAADDIIPEDFQDFPGAVFFNEVVFPDSCPD
jgi:hypothetical protein